MQQPYRRRYNKFSCKVTKKNGNLSAFKYLFAPQCRNDPAFFASKAVKAVDAEDIAEVRSGGALVVDKFRPFGKKQTSLREETNVSSGRNECLLAKRRTSPREGTKTTKERETPTSHPQMRATLRTKSGRQAICAATSALSRKAQPEDRKAPSERK